MRSWDESGVISPAPLPGLGRPIPDRSTGFVSLEDLGDDRRQLESLISFFPHLALTLGPRGVEYHTGGRILQIAAPAETEVDSTGAGDIFAAAFLIFHHLRGKSIEESAWKANALATASIRKPGQEGIPLVNEIIEINKVQR